MRQHKYRAPSTKDEPVPSKTAAPPQKKAAGVLFLKFPALPSIVDTQATGAETRQNPESVPRQLLELSTEKTIGMSVDY